LEKSRCDADIAVAHHKYVVARFGQHAIQAEDFCIGIDRLAGDDQAGGAGRELFLKCFNDRDGGIVWGAHCE